VRLEIGLSDVLMSTMRWFVGTAIGCTCGACVGLLLVGAPVVRHGGIVVAGFLRSLPILALASLVRRYLGISEFEKVGLIAWATFFPVLISAGNADYAKLDEVRLRFALSRPSTFEWLRHYTAPIAALGLLKGVETSLGIGWLTVVAAELIGQEYQGLFAGGLGFKTATAFDSGAFWLGMGGLGAFGLMGFLTAVLWSAVLRRAMDRLGMSEES
jgi:ABC-type nitrate/sulfonate/bicarbonate transport system permease component